MTPSRAVTFIDERLIKRWSAQEAVAPQLSLNAFLRSVAEEGRAFGGNGSLQVLLSPRLLGLALFTAVRLGVQCNTGTHAGALCLCMAQSSKFSLAIVAPSPLPVPLVLPSSLGPSG